MSDDEIDGIIPADYWLNKCKYALTVKVHQRNECFMKQPAEAPPGGSRKQIRKNDTERKAALRAADAAARQESINVRTQSELRNLETKEKLVEENIHRSMMKRVKDTIKNYQTQLKLLREMKEDYIEINGDEAYKSQLKDLMDGLFNAQSTIEASASASSTAASISAGDAAENVTNTDDEEED